jgi:hypothetical protein
MGKMEEMGGDALAIGSSTHPPFYPLSFILYPSSFIPYPLAFLAPECPTAQTYHHKRQD